MSQSTVSSIIEKEKDSRGVEILYVYNRNPPKYAVYRTADQVMIQFADDTEVDKDGKRISSQQRQALLPLMPIRGEINGLIDGWRNSSNENRIPDENSDSRIGKVSKKSNAQALAKLFDRQTADALVVALEGDIGRATALLETLKEAVSEERRSVARAQYLRWATFCALGLIALSWVIPALISAASNIPGAELTITNFSDMQLRTAVTFGVLGALFSIALDIRDRSIETDFQKRDNIADSLLRVTVGAMSAIVLFSLLKSGILGVEINNSEIELAAQKGKIPHTAIVIAFLAGFSERLVGGVLAKVEKSVSASEKAKGQHGAGGSQTTNQGGSST